MSTFKVEVVQIGAVTKHPNADSLSMTTVFGQNVIFRTGDFNGGDLAIYVPYDAVVDLTNKRFAFLAKASTKTSMRIRPIRLRGVYSEGLLLPIEPGMDVGDDVSIFLNVKKYEEPEEKSPVRGLRAAPAVKDPGISPKYDLESFHRYGESFQVGEEVVMTEKIHGCSSRFVYHDGKFYVGSHNLFRERPRDASKLNGVIAGIKRVARHVFSGDFTNIQGVFLREYNNKSREIPADAWWKIAIDYDLESKLKDYPDMVLYGEIYGHVQDLTYSVPAETIVRFAAFDVFDAKQGRYLDHDDAMDFCFSLNIPVVPELYHGPFSKEIVEELTADGTKSYIDGKTMREGVVIRPIFERHDHNGRVVMKAVSRQYKSRNGGTEKH